MTTPLDVMLLALREAEAQLTDVEREAIEAEQIAILAHVHHHDAVARAKARLEKAADAYWEIRNERGPAPSRYPARRDPDSKKSEDES